MSFHSRPPGEPREGWGEGANRWPGRQCPVEHAGDGGATAAAATARSTAPIRLKRPQNSSGKFHRIDMTFNCIHCDSFVLQGLHFFYSILLLLLLSLLFLPSFAPDAIHSSAFRLLLFPLGRLKATETIRAISIIFFGYNKSIK